MVLCGDGDCSVCLLAFSRVDRIPRVLHCRHTFCEPCLHAMSRVRSGLLAVPCPLCRRVTCVGRDRGLQQALWVNRQLWEQIPEEASAPEQAAPAKQQPSAPAESEASWRSSGRRAVPAFFRRFSLARQRREEVIPGGNVEMKSWRRLSADEAL